ncbi:hypothetical protein BJ170DRAFT_147300 [Xylariales sp. AK1849]|nr:hypothetical protein BJ170DRAFT_147300 [Xylariales sp. AK1849]
MTMESRKRKVPPRAAARVEQVAKKRTATPPAERSLTPAPAPVSEPIVEEPRLPSSIQAGSALPTVENAQPDDLSSKEYQSMQESGVLAESLTRSRQKWINEGIFEKYWTKPYKRKGVVKEEPNNPPKDSMTKIGHITITVEPHVLEATMFAVNSKDSKPSAPTTNSTFRPVMQYGPPNGVMPPPPKPPTPSTPSTPSAVPGSPSQAPAQPAAQASSAPRAPSQPPTPSQPEAQTHVGRRGVMVPAPLVTQASSAPTAPSQPPTPSQPQPQTHVGRPGVMVPAPTRGPPLASPRGIDSVLAAPGAPHTQPPLRSPALSAAQAQPLASPANLPGRPAAPSPPPAAAGAPKPPTPGAKPATPTPSGADPIIVTLAERASEDAHLRDLMKRVAIGEAAPHELAHFQKIIDQITAEYKKKGGQQGPSADRLIVDGRTVKYFADEVRAILDIVLASNPNQKSSDLRPPPGSDALVILLVRKALEDHTTRNMVRRVAENKTKFSDTTDLKSILDKLKDLVPKDAPKPQSTAAPPPAKTAEATVNGASATKPSATPKAAPASSQALRSKGPPPSLKLDMTAIVLEFSGGTGDRYLFPKYSMLEYQPGRHEVLASFLIVRKGSRSEYGGDPAMDYYQPVTVRISSPSGKHLENLARVVAPQDEVRRYMDDIMDNMTRAEYILLAMRLPRPDKDEQADDEFETPKSDGQQQQLPPPQPGVLWTTKATPKSTSQPVGKVLGEDEQYQSFIATVS